ncbi:glutathione synthetase [Desulfuromonas versatilis]|uniref:Glutathione synthetase n=1 Tax=Desulfuromonas versatilis TaxID=2802975 RepID=A0ABM8HQM1_9BACT|nr:glutathione synthase [Desulfuromonas versatilis]BCR04142.1 glutathione synthetase [Desulfuromonas versatilis]
MNPRISVFVIDPPERLDPPTDTSLALMRESLRRKHRVYYCTIDQLKLEDRRVQAAVHPVSFAPGQELFQAGAPRPLDLAECDILYMRKDPPVDITYLHATYLLEQLPSRVVQVNPAAALRNYCEKLIPIQFARLWPETLVSASAETLAAFLDQVGRMVVKPLEDCSGRGIFILDKDQPDRSQRLREAVRQGRRFVEGQRYLPEISQGDKRVLLLGGAILGQVRRLPPPGEFRSNVNAGGRCVPCELTDGDREICARIGPWLAERSIHLAGVDIVGDKVLEVNITSPSCLREMNELYGLSLEANVLDYLEGLLPARPPAP